MTGYTFSTMENLTGSCVSCQKEDIYNNEFVQICINTLEDRGVLVFRELGLSDKEQLDFTDRIGIRGTFTKNIPGSDAATSDVYTITLDKKVNRTPEYVLGTYFWHVDGVTTDLPLPKATLLTARQTAASGGGTQFANLYAAFEHLPDSEKIALADLKVVHTMEASLRPVFDRPSEEMLATWRTMSSRMVHPLVWTHASGRRSLMIGIHADSIVGMPLAEGRALLARLMEWAARPEFTYSHTWRQGDFVIWDNCGVMHRVIPYDENSGRRMHRTTIIGDERIAGSYALAD